MAFNFYSEPPFYSKYLKKLQELKKDFPFLQIFPIGQSLLGRNIYTIILGCPNPLVLFAGAFHAQEWLTCTLLIHYLEHLSLSYQNHTKIADCILNTSLSQRGIAVIPMVNPDGVSIALEGVQSAGNLASSIQKMQQQGALSWQANAAGVDLNHNFNAGFHELRKMELEHGITQPCARQYGGIYPHSEPETQTLVSFLKNRRVETAYAFHSQGEEIYSEYGSHMPAQSKYIGKLLSESSGYRLIQNEGLCSHGGFKDYFIKKYKRPGFTIEIGKGENPLPITDLNEIYAKLLQTLVIATVI